MLSGKSNQFVGNAIAVFQFSEWNVLMYEKHIDLA